MKRTVKKKMCNVIVHIVFCIVSLDKFHRKEENFPEASPEEKIGCPIACQYQSSFFKWDHLLISVTSVEDLLSKDS